MEFPATANRRYCQSTIRGKILLDSALKLGILFDNCLAHYVHFQVSSCLNGSPKVNLKLHIWGRRKLFEDQSPRKYKQFIFSSPKRKRFPTFTQKVRVLWWHQKKCKFLKLCEHHFGVSSTLKRCSSTPTWCKFVVMSCNWSLTIHNGADLYYLTLLVQYQADK